MRTSLPGHIILFCSYSTILTLKILCNELYRAILYINFPQLFFTKKKSNKIYNYMVYNLFEF